MNREHFMELVEMLRPRLEAKSGNFRSDALSVEKKVSSNDIVLFERLRIVPNDMQQLWSFIALLV